MGNGKQTLTEVTGLLLELNAGSTLETNHEDMAQKIHPFPLQSRMFPVSSNPRQKSAQNVTQTKCEVCQNTHFSEFN